MEQKAKVMLQSAQGRFHCASKTARSSDGTLCTTCEAMGLDEVEITAIVSPPSSTSTTMKSTTSSLSPSSPTSSSKTSRCCRLCNAPIGMALSDAKEALDGATKKFEEVRHALEAARKREMAEVKKEEQALRFLLTAGQAMAHTTTSSSKSDNPHAQRSGGTAQECVVCEDNLRDTALAPCGHVVLCQACSGGMTTCPVCATKIISRLRLYFS